MLKSYINMKFARLVDSIRLQYRPELMLTKSMRCIGTKSNQPGPHLLPKEDQDEFEALQKLAASQEAIEAYNEAIKHDHTRESLNNKILTKNDIGAFSPEFSRTIPEFEGEINPKTGERGGPKQDPLRHGDYSFNGRVTDF